MRPFSESVIICQLWRDAWPDCPATLAVLNQTVFAAGSCNMALSPVFEEEVKDNSARKAILASLPGFKLTIPEVWYGITSSAQKRVTSQTG